MLAITAGPPRKPVFAATKSNPASKASTSASVPSLIHAGIPRVPIIDWKVTAFRVCPSTCLVPHNRYSRMMPPAVKARDSAMYIIVSFPVRMRGSLSIFILLDTASMPV